MDKVWNSITFIGGFVASFLEPVAAIVSRRPKGALVVWGLSLALVAWLF